MDFPSQYENLGLIFEGETKTFRARETATHRQVLLHQLSSNVRSGRQLHLLAQALRYTSAPRTEGHNAILGIEEQGDFVWVVTEDAPELLNLWEWMERQSSKASVPQAVTGSPGQPQTSVDAHPPTMDGDAPATLDEKTAIFAARLGSAGAVPLVDLEPPPAEERTQTFTQRPSAAPASEVTTVFERPPAPPVAPPAPAPPPAVSGVDPSSAPGEFTMLFRKPPGAASPADQKPRFMGYTAPAQENAKTIETSRTTFIQPPRPEAEARTVQMPAPPAAPSAETSASGEFTTVFDRPVPAVSQSELQPSGFSVASSPLWGQDAAAPGEFTQVFDARSSSSRETPDAAGSGEPGAFTRIFQIPVGSDLLAAAEPKTVRTMSPAAAQPPAWQPEAIPAPPAAQSVPPAVSPPAAKPAGPPVEIRIPPAPQMPRVPQIPQAPKLPIAGGGGGAPNIPQFTPPKLPSAAAPKIPKVPGIEKAEGLPGPSILPLILVFGGIVLVAVLLVVFFVTKH